MDRTKPQTTSSVPRRSRAAGAAVLAAVLGIALSGPPTRAQVYVPTKDLQHPKVRYADSLLSMNDRCPVRTGKLSTTYKPVYVNNRPIGFC
jgi:hypothetical protein